MDGFIKDRAREEIFSLKPYVPGKPIEEVKRELGIDDIVKMASNENPMGPSPLAREAVSRILDKLHFYPDSNCYYLIQKLASFLGVGEDTLIIGNGSDEILKFLAETFIDRGDQVVFADPSFVEYEFTAMIMGAECIKVPLVDFVHDLDAMLEAVTDRCKIVYLCNPNNPTGTVVSRQAVDDFMDRVPPDVLVVFDEAYYEYVEDQDFVSGLHYLEQGKNVVVLRTFSKIYGLAGLRVGYAVTRPHIAQAVSRVIEPFNVNMLAQEGATAALDDEAHLQASQQANRQGKQYLYGEFARMGLDYVPTEANFIFVDTGRDSQEVFKKLMGMGVIIRTGDIFGFPTHIRVTIGSQEENSRFIRALENVLGTS